MDGLETMWISDDLSVSQRLHLNTSRYSPSMQSKIAQNCETFLQTCRLRKQNKIDGYTGDAAMFRDKTEM